MATTVEDKRVVIISVTASEMVNLLGTKAKDAGIIDFDPDSVDIKSSDDPGIAFTVIFEKST